MILAATVGELRDDLMSFGTFRVHDPDRLVCVIDGRDEYDLCAIGRPVRWTSPPASPESRPCWPVPSGRLRQIWQSLLVTPQLYTIHGSTVGTGDLEGVSAAVGPELAGEPPAQPASRAPVSKSGRITAWASLMGTLITAGRTRRRASLQRWRRRQTRPRTRLRSGPRPGPSC